MLESLVERVKDAAGRKVALSIQGGGTKRFYGLPATGDLLDIRGHAGIVSYEPTELVLHAKAGTSLQDIDTLLAGADQMLAFEPPHFGLSATLGGCVAAGLSGPARISAGSVRDFVLGATLLDGRGDVLRFGGQVMKNVAGYDVSRLLAGSMGTLGVLLDVSLKVLPRPHTSLTIVLAVSAGEALKYFNVWRARALPITASAWHDGLLYVRLSGARTAVASARRELGGEVASEAADFWLAAREQTHPFFAGDAPLWRLALPAGTPLLELGEAWIEWGGMQRFLRGEIDALALRQRVSAAGGHATLFRASDEARRRNGVFSALPQQLMAIHRQLKLRFDPAGIFNPQRMYPDF